MNTPGGMLPRIVVVPAGEHFHRDESMVGGRDARLEDDSEGPVLDRLARAAEHVVLVDAGAGQSWSRERVRQCRARFVGDLRGDGGGLQVRVERPVDAAGFHHPGAEGRLSAEAMEARR